MPHSHLFDVIVTHQGFESGESWRQGRGLAIQVDEQEALPLGAGYFRQCTVVALGVAVKFHARGPHQAPLEIVGPGVVGALKMSR